MEDLLQYLHRLGRARSQNQAVGPVEVFHGTTVGEEHWLRHDGGLEPNILDTFLQRVRRADRDGSDDGQDWRLGREARDANSNVVEILGFVFRQENDAGSSG